MRLKTYFELKFQIEIECKFQLNVEFEFENKKVQFKVSFEMQIDVESAKIEEENFDYDGPQYFTCA